MFNDQLVGLSASDKYWPALCLGKRIGVFNDLNNTSIIMTSQFKQITGGDKVSIEQKYEKTFSAVLETKFILTTNRSINIINDVAERRRAIMVEIAPDQTFIEDFEERLTFEGNYFLYKCKLAYEELYDRKRNQINCDYSFFEEESGSYEEHHEALFDKLFVLDPNATCSAENFFSDLTSEIGHDNNKVSSFKEWLKRTHKIQRSRLTTGARSNIYRGFKAKV